LTIILKRNGKNIKTIIKETKQQLTEMDESRETLKNRWYDEECKIAIEEMKKQGKIVLDFKLSPCSICNMFSFG